MLLFERQYEKRGVAAQVVVVKDDVPRVVALIVAIAQAGYAFAPAAFALLRDPHQMAAPLFFVAAAGVQTLAILKAKARSKSAAVSVELGADLPRALGVAGELNQIWANLIDNALDAVPDGGRVEVTATREREGVAVRVIDDGPGIPADVRPRIFDPFFTTKPPGEGTGLGLSVSYGIVAEHGGWIAVESALGRGSVFSVYLPLGEGEA